jgi:hypothetical protein
VLRRGDQLEPQDFKYEVAISYLERDMGIAEPIYDRAAKAGIARSDPADGSCSLSRCFTSTRPCWPQIRKLKGVPYLK